MKYAFFQGCRIQSQLTHYGTLTAAILKKTGVGTVNLPFNCCGYPARDTDYETSVFASAWNIALAEKHGLDILTPCSCCYGSLKHADYALGQNRRLADRINEMLAGHGLRWSGSVSIKLLLSCLYEDIGCEAIEKKIKRPLTGLTIAASYGCHALRPSQVTRFDNPACPHIFEDILRAAGAQTADWTARLECCGNPLLGKDAELSFSLAGVKSRSASDSGAQIIATACTYCQLQFQYAREKKGPAGFLPSFTISELLAFAMGLPSARKIPELKLLETLINERRHN